MGDLTLRTSIGNYGHTTPLKDGTIASDRFGMDHVEISPVPMIFRRMVRNLEFDVAEMALATYFCARAHGKKFTAIPIFLTRDFYHGALVYNRRSGIESPKDLEGRKVGVRSYTFTPGVWTRGLLSSEYGVDLSAITWTLSGDEHVEEYVAPSNVAQSPNNDLVQMLLSGEIDAAIAPGPVDSPDILPMFPNSNESDDIWHRKTGLYPISHLLVVKDSTLDANESLATDLFDLFRQAKLEYICSLLSGGASNPSDDSILEMAEIVGDNPLPYGYESSRESLETFMNFNVEQGVAPEAVDPAELFAPETLSLPDSV